MQKREIFVKQNKHDHKFFLQIIIIIIITIIIIIIIIIVIITINIYLGSIHKYNGSCSYKLKKNINKRKKTVKITYKIYLINICVP